ncbi:unnamed protein product [Mycena citricolor]|uniref:Uncharacterized protein n=1 Tax=Mycena citricolor TaxID=2018698 RepID=A0AAD2H573_9AGAR|nr:unnamed protein product [Mycena citricolor]
MWSRPPLAPTPCTSLWRSSPPTTQSSSLSGGWLTAVPCQTSLTPPTPPKTDFRSSSSPSLSQSTMWTARQTKLAPFDKLPMWSCVTKDTVSGSSSLSLGLASRS